MFGMKSWKLLFVAVGLVAIGISAYGGPVPQRINYQGTLGNKTGGPANGSFNMTFRVYSTATGNTPLWSESWNSGSANSSPVVVTDGVFNIMLGSITPFSNDFFAAYPKTYLGVAVANDSEMLPRQLIASVGYAFAAGNGVPKGGVIMWSGAITAIPEGWALCDGANGTPNLRDRFVVGAGSTYAVGATGGEATHILTTLEIPSHTHIQDAHNHSQNPHRHVQAQVGVSSGSGQTVADNSTTDEWGTASTTATNNPVTPTNQYAGGGQAHNNLPPYYALAFIMKL